MLHEMCGKQAERSLTKVRFFSQSGLKRTAWSMRAFANDAEAHSPRSETLRRGDY